MKILSTLILTLMTFISWSNENAGPIIGCNNCEWQSNGAKPVSGSWYNPQQSGSGYLLNVQKEFVLGYYFGYTTEGEPTWLTFQGPLQPSQDEQVNWVLEAPLVKVSNGNAFNQPHQFPTNIDQTGDTIRIDFRYAHYASVQINDLDAQNIIPLNFSVESSQDFEQSDHLFPELEGVWTFVLKVNDPNLLGLFAYFGGEFYFYPKSEPSEKDGSNSIRYVLSDYHFPESQNFASIYCNNGTNPDTTNPELRCTLSNMPSIGDKMPIAPGDIGPNYIYAENANGDVFEAFRVNYIPNFGLPSN